MSVGIEKIREATEGKKVLYIATKNSDYIRVSQEINELKQHCNELKVVAFSDKSYLSRMRKVFLYLAFHSVSQYDVVFIGFMAQMVVPLFQHKFRRSVLIVDFFISIYDTLVDDRKKFKEQSMVARILKHIDHKTIKKADIIIADTNAHADYFASEFHINRELINTWYITADTDIFYPRILKRPVELQEKFVVMYFGSILPVQGVEVILDCIERMKENKQIHFIMVGPISEKYYRPDTDNVTYIDWLAQEELANYIAYADLCLGGHFSATIGKAKRTIPGKVYIYKSMNKKVVLGDSPANRELFAENEDNIYVPMGDAEKLSRTIEVEMEKWKHEKQ